MRAPLRLYAGSIKGVCVCVCVCVCIEIHRRRRTKRQQRNQQQRRPLLKELLPKKLLLMPR